MPRWLPIALVVVVLLGVAAYGVLRPGTESGRNPADVQQRLSGVPRQIEKWTCGEDRPLTERTVNTGRFQAYLNRTYTHPGGTAVAVMVLYGETGDLGAHDPTVCYAGGGWELSDSPRKVTVGVPREERVELWKSTFRKQTQSLQVYWGWGTNGEWRAADNPRFEFARYRRIYKLYAQRLANDTEPPPKGGPTSEPLEEFLALFLQRLDEVVQPSP